MELRKHKEREFHDFQRKVEGAVYVADAGRSPDLGSTIRSNPQWSNNKYYSIERKSRGIVLQWFKTHCPGKKVLDYCCGWGDDGLLVAAQGAAEVIGIDISEVAIQICRTRAEREGLTNISNQVMDAEALEFPDNTFDVVTEYGALHHLDLDAAYGEVARVLRPGGRFLCVEALGHNQIIHLYRKLTPYYRTEWEAEHILKKDDVELGRHYFHRLNIIGFYHMATLGAVPLRNTPIFKKVLGALESVDEVLLKLPFLRWQAWHIVFELVDPIKQPR
jgi:2-polyprenyl-3-methyl-5-hydroxy-6-metoxy-1,4-benzoquinol methylase